MKGHGSDSHVGPAREPSAALVLVVIALVMIGVATTLLAVAGADVGWLWVSIATTAVASVVLYVGCLLGRRGATAMATDALGQLERVTPTQPLRSPFPAVAIDEDAGGARPAEEARFSPSGMPIDQGPLRQGHRGRHLL